MGFNLLPLSVIPNFRITNKGLVDVNTMKIVPYLNNFFLKFLIVLKLYTYMGCLDFNKIFKKYIIISHCPLNFDI